MARLRRTDEPLNLAWDNDRDHWRAGIDPNGDEDDPDATPIVPKIVNGDVVGYTSGGEFRGFYVEAEGIKPDSMCAKSGCSEDEGDHACGGPACGRLLETQSNYQFPGYNGWMIDAEEMKIMTCVQAAVSNENPDDWQPEDDDDDFEHRSVILTALSESCLDEFEVTHVPYRHGVGGTIYVSDIELIDDGWGVPFHGPCYQLLKRRAMAFESPRPLCLLDGILDMCGVSQARHNRSYCKKLTTTSDCITRFGE